MTVQSLKIVHYLNQFFGGLGGEDKAHLGPRVIAGPVGPGRAIEALMEERGRIVATLLCGDNYFAENIEKAAEEICESALPYRPDLALAGPAFNAGRYGIACGATCKAFSTRFQLPAVTGMFRENPGVDLYQNAVYIIRTSDSALGMQEALRKMVTLALKLAAGEKIGCPAQDGYFPRGYLVNESVERTGAQRVVDMVLHKLQGIAFESEISRPRYDRVEPAPAVKDLPRKTIAIVTDGGLVPKGNPDRIEIRTATRYGRYSFGGQKVLLPGDYEVNHEGYDSIFVRRDPHRLVPVDVLREFEEDGVIGSLYPRFYSTTGVANIVDTMKTIGRSIAAELREAGVSAVILTST
jgi:glycine reductase complex component B subunit gamma